MRIAIVSPYSLAAWGGVQAQVVGLVEWLRAAGHDAWAVAPGDGGPAGTRHVGSVTTVPGNRSRAPIALRPGTAGRVRAALEDADVVHIHEPFMPLVGWAALRAPSGPKVGTFHADAPSWVRGAYGAGRPVLRRWANRLEAATAVSPVAAAPLRGVIDVEIIPNAVDVAAYTGESAPHAGEIERKQRRVVFVGRDEPRKGLDVILTAWPRVREAVPDCELVVVGASRDALPGVTFAGRVPEAEKRALFRSSGVFCAPNLGSESFGIVVVEGMAAGCAVVASALPAFTAVLDGAGVETPIGDAAALAAALVRVLGEPATRDHLQRAARKRASRFDRAVVFAEYLAVYRRVGRV